MPVNTLKEAWQLGRRVRVKCNMRDHWKEAHRDPAISCHASDELDRKTLVRTRGATPIKELQDRLRSPACGSPTILVFVEVPNEPAAVGARGRIDPDDWQDESGG
jgi:hypothetical protein